MPSWRCMYSRTHETLISNYTNMLDIVDTEQTAMPEIRRIKRFTTGWICDSDGEPVSPLKHSHIRYSQLRISQKQRTEFIWQGHVLHSDWRIYHGNVNFTHSTWSRIIRGTSMYSLVFWSFSLEIREAHWSISTARLWESIQWKWLRLAFHSLFPWSMRRTSYSVVKIVKFDPKVRTNVSPGTLEALHSPRGANSRMKRLINVSCNTGSGEIKRYLGLTMISLTPEIINELQMRNHFIPPGLTEGALVWKVVVGSPAHKYVLQKNNK